MNINRFDEIAEQLRALLAMPMPAEKHLLREKLCKRPGNDVLLTSQ